jgi:uncharacterized protein (DUF1800 family)
MDKNALWSLRLGFSTAQQDFLQEMGLMRFLTHSFEDDAPLAIPKFMANRSHDLKSIRERRRMMSQSSHEEKMAARRQQRQDIYSMSYDWIQRMQSAQLPLRENMTCFWHNHFVVAYQKVRIAPWLFEHHHYLHAHAFGNFRDLTKAMLRSNAMINYLDNHKNRKGANNENLARELLELFTLGIENYKEIDVKNAAKALAGLGHGDGQGQYRDRLREKEPVEFLGEKGVFDSDDIVDIIFDQQAIPYLMTEKILKWFVYDNPSADLIKSYGDYFREQDFEIRPLLEKVFLTEYEKNPVATKIKDPLRFALQTIHQLSLEDRIEPMQIAKFLRDQSMELYNQPNVKGWEGGRAWLTSAIYLRRNQVARFLASGENINQRAKMNRFTDPELPDLVIPKNIKTNKEVIAYLLDQTLSVSTPSIQKDLEDILKYDFKPHTPGAELGILRAYEYIITTPEYQVI